MPLLISNIDKIKNQKQYPLRSNFPIFAKNRLINGSEDFISKKVSSRTKAVSIDPVDNRYEISSLGNQLFDNLIVKHSLKYYLHLYEKLANVPEKQEKILEILASESYLNLEVAVSIDKIKELIAEKGYIILPYDFHKEKHRARFQTLENILELRQKLISSENIDSFDVTALEQEIKYVLYFLEERHHPEYINLNEIQNKNLQEIVKAHIQYEKSNDFYLHYLIKEFLELVNNNKNDEEIKRQIVSLLEIAPEDFPSTLDKNSLENYFNKKLDPEALKEYQQLKPPTKALVECLFDIRKFLTSSDYNGEYFELAMKVCMLSAKLLGSDVSTEVLNHELDTINTLINKLPAEKSVASDILKSKIEQLSLTYEHFLEAKITIFKDAYQFLKSYLLLIDSKNPSNTVSMQTKPYECVSFINLVSKFSTLIDKNLSHASSEADKSAAFLGIDDFMEHFEALNINIDSKSFTIQRSSIEIQKLMEKFRDHLLFKSFDQSSAFFDEIKKLSNKLTKDFGLKKTSYKTASLPSAQLFLKINELFCLLPMEQAIINAKADLQAQAINSGERKEQWVTFKQNILGDQLFDDLMSKHFLYYYLNLYEKLDKNLVEQKNILNILAGPDYLDAHESISINDATQLALEKNYQFSYGNSDSLFDLAKFETIQKLIEFYNNAKLNKPKNLDKLKQEVNYILYFLFECPHPEYINFDAISNIQLRVIATNYYQKDKANKTFLGCLIKKLLTIDEISTLLTNEDYFKLIKIIEGILGISIQKEILEFPSPSAIEAILEEKFEKLNLNFNLHQNLQPNDNADINDLVENLIDLYICLLVKTNNDSKYQKIFECIRGAASELGSNLRLSFHVVKIDSIISQIKNSGLLKKDQENDRIDNYLNSKIAQINFLQENFFKDKVTAFEHAYKILFEYFFHHDYPHHLETYLSKIQDQDQYTQAIKFANLIAKLSSLYNQINDSQTRSKNGKAIFTFKLEEHFNKFNQLNKQLSQNKLLPQEKYLETQRIVEQFFDEVDGNMYSLQQLNLSNDIGLVQASYDPALIPEIKQLLNSVAESFNLENKKLTNIYSTEKLLKKINKLIRSIPVDEAIESAKADLEKWANNCEIQANQIIPTDEKILEDDDNLHDQLFFSDSARIENTDKISQLLMETNQSVSLLSEVSAIPQNKSGKPVSQLSVQNENKDLLSKYSLKYYLNMYQSSNNNSIERKKLSCILEHMTDISANEITIDKLNQIINSKGYTFAPYDFCKKSHRARFEALHQIISLYSKNRFSLDSDSLRKEINYILYFIEERNHPEHIDLSSISNNELREIANNYRFHNHYDKIQKIELHCLLKQLLNLATKNDTHSKIQCEKLKSKIANLLDISDQSIPNTLDKDALQKYFKKVFERLDIGIPTPKDPQQYDAKINALVEELLDISVFLSINNHHSYRHIGSQAHALSVKLLYTRELSENLNNDLNQICKQIKQLKHNTNGKKENLVDKFLLSKMSQMETTRGKLLQDNTWAFKDAYHVLNDYIAKGKLPSASERYLDNLFNHKQSPKNMTFRKLILKLNTFVDQTTRFRPDAKTGKYACPYGMDRFLEKFEALNSSISDGSCASKDQYYQIQKLMEEFWDYTWQQVNIQQRYDLQDIDPSMPNQALLNTTFLRDIKKLLNDLSRDFGLNNRKIKNTHPTEQLFMKINKLISLLPNTVNQKKVRSLFINKRNELIGTHDVSSIRHLPEHLVVNVNEAHYYCGDEIQKVSSLMELYRCLQSAVSQFSNEDRIENNLEYLMSKVAKASDIQGSDPRFANLFKEIENEKHRLVHARNEKRINETQYFQDLQQLRAKILSHLVAGNIPVASMNPLSQDLNPTVMQFKRVKKRNTVSHYKQQYRKQKKVSTTGSFLGALSFAFGQFAMAFLGLSMTLPAIMPVWLAISIIGLALTSTAISQYKFVYKSDLSLFSQLFIFKDIWLGYKSFAGKSLITLTYGLSALFSLTFAVVVISSFPPFAAATTPMLIALFAYKGFAAFTAFATFVNMTLFMTVFVAQFWNRVFNALSSWFPEIAAANERAEVLGKSLGFTGLMTSLGQGLGRFVSVDLYKNFSQNVSWLFNRAYNYVKNPTGDPSAPTFEKVCKGLEDVLMLLYSAGILLGAGYLCYLSCTSSIAGWGGIFNSQLVAIGLPIYFTSTMTLVVVKMATNFINTLFNIDSFSTQSVSLARMFSQLTVDITVRLPIYTISKLFNAFQRTVSGQIFGDLFGESGAITRFWADPSQNIYSGYYNTYEFVSSVINICFETVVIFFNAMAFSSPIAYEAISNSSKPKATIAAETAANVTNSAVANAGGAKARFALLTPHYIPQATKLISDLVTKDVHQGIVFGKDADNLDQHVNHKNSMPTSEVDAKVSKADVPLYKQTTVKKPNLAEKHFLGGSQPVWDKRRNVELAFDSDFYITRSASQSSPTAA